MKTRTLHPHRDTFLTKHHLLPKSRKLKHFSRPHNLLNIWWDRHMVWHQIFLNYTIHEIIQNWYKFKSHFNTKKWKILFHNLDFEDSKKLLIRLVRIKRRQKSY